jgi:hypothetical protein
MHNQFYWPCMPVRKQTNHLSIFDSMWVSVLRCIAVAGAYGAQKTDVNISLTAIGLLWTTSDFFARGTILDAR